MDGDGEGRGGSRWDEDMQHRTATARDAVLPREVNSEPGLVSSRGLRVLEVAGTSASSGSGLVTRADVDVAAAAASKASSPPPAPAKWRCCSSSSAPPSSSSSPLSPSLEPSS